MRNLYVLSLLFMVCSTVWAQNDSIQLVDIKYNYVVRGNVAKDITHKAVYDLFLIPDFGVSVYDKEIDTAPRIENPVRNSAVIAWKPKGKNLSTLYKNYARNEMYLKNYINFRFFVQKDSLTIFDWDIKEETKTIRGYNCQAAITTFRGRNYKAWFTTELPVCGPWKFDSLPGAILEVKAVDDYVSWEAISIIVNKQKPDYAKPENPFLSEKALSWTEFKSLYKEKAIAASKYTTKEGEKLDIVATRIGVERYIEEDDKDYQADKVMKKIMNGNN
jgi:GLPGLI family protein